MRAVILVFCLAFVSPAAAQYANPQYQPTGAAATNAPTFSWPNTPGAASYVLFFNQLGPDRIVTVTASQANCGATGCSFSPGIVFRGGDQVGWWVEPHDAAGAVIAAAASPELMFYAPIPGGNNTWPADFSNKFDDQPCHEWHYVSDFPEQTRRVINVFLYGGGGGNPSDDGDQTFHKAIWTPVDVSDLVPSNARAALLSMELIYSASCAQIEGCDLIGFSTRRHGASQSVSGVLRYTVSPRTPLEVTVLLSGGMFDFYWDTVANGINVAAVNGSVVTGEAVVATLVGYCVP